MTPTTISSPTGRPHWPGSATRPASRSTPGPASCPIRGGPRSPTSTSTRARRRPGRRRSSLARLYRTALGHLGVRGYPKTTGKRGIQIWIPIEPKYDFDQTSTWVERVSRAVGSTVPDLISWEWAKEARKGRARLDYTQNASIKTLVAPYPCGRRPGRPVSTPISWDELDDPDLRPDRWTIRTLPERVAKVVTCSRRPRPMRRSCRRSDGL